jgi:mRNA interferase HigB
MHVISRRRLLEAALVHGDLGAALNTWYRIAKKERWQSLEDVRQVLPTADGVGRYTVFNINMFKCKGNNFRLIAEINYQFGRLYIRHVLTHAAYDKGAWKR